MGLAAESDRPPVWLMRQAGRYMAEFRKCALPPPSAMSVHQQRVRPVHTTRSWELVRPAPPAPRVRRYSETIPFRERSETPEIAIELSLQPWRAYQPDGVIFFSDILTPLPAIGVEFDVIRGKVTNPSPSHVNFLELGQDPDSRSTRAG